MVKINIDEHILKEIIDNFSQISKDIETVDKCWNSIVARHERSKALIAYLVGEVEIEDNRPDTVS